MSNQNEKIVIREMPNRETLEAFIAGTMGPTRVTFNIEKGVFEPKIELPVQKKDETIDFNPS